MNSLSLEAVRPTNPYTDMEVRLRRLPKHVQREVLSRAIDWGVSHGVAEWRAMGGPSMGALSQDALSTAVGTAVQKAITPLMPTLSAELMKAVEPAAAKAADVVGPVLEEKLKKYAPIFGIVAGLVAAAFGVLGMMIVGGYVVKKVG